MSDAAMTLDQLPGIEGQGYIFLRGGITQHYIHDGVEGLLVATTRDAASRLVKRFKAEGIKFSIGEVGVRLGETLLQHFEAAEQFGAQGIYFTSDGETLSFLAPPPESFTVA